MGLSSVPESQFPTHIKMKFLSALFLAASAAAIEDTADVKAAKASFNTAFEAAKAGAHAGLAPVQGPTSYLADAADVAAAKADFAASFAAVVPAYAAAAQFYNGYYGGFYNGYYPHHAAYNYAGYHPYAAYGAFPYAFAPYHYVKP